MTLILIEGGDDAASFSAATTAGTTGAGRHGKGITGNAGNLIIPAAQQADTFTMGVAVRTTSVASNATWIAAIGTVGGVDLSLRLDAGGSLSVRRASTILKQTAAAFITVNTWYYIEWQARIHDTLGTTTVNANGSNVAALTGTGLDTKQSTGTTFDWFQIGANNWDDLYLMTGTGDTFLGDCTVEILYPNGNGNANAWVGSDGNSTDNYLLVNETPVVATSYAGSPTSGAQDLYTFTDLTGTGVIYGVMHAAHAAASDAGAKQIKIVNRHASDTKSAALSLTSTYTTLGYVLTTDPETGAAWISPNVNALQSGCEVV